MLASRYRVCSGIHHVIYVSVLWTDFNNLTRAKRLQVRIAPELRRNNLVRPKICIDSKYLARFGVAHLKCRVSDPNKSNQSNVSSLDSDPIRPKRAATRIPYQNGLEWTATGYPGLNTINTQKKELCLLFESTSQKGTFLAVAVFSDFFDENQCSGSSLGLTTKYTATFSS